MGVNIRSTVRKAAKLAVYDEMMMRVKNHQTLPTMRPDIDLEQVRCAKYESHEKLGVSGHTLRLHSNKVM